MTARKANHLIRDALLKLGVIPIKISARTISFADLARDSRVFVDVTGLDLNDLTIEERQAIKALANLHGFNVHFV